MTATTTTTKTSSDFIPLLGMPYDLELQTSNGMPIESITISTIEQLDGSLCKQRETRLLDGTVWTDTMQIPLVVQQRPTSKSPQPQQFQQHQHLHEQHARMLPTSQHRMARQHESRISVTPWTSSSTTTATTTPTGTCSSRCNDTTFHSSQPPPNASSSSSPCTTTTRSAVLPTKTSPMIKIPLQRPSVTILPLFTQQKKERQRKRIAWLRFLCAILVWIGIFSLLYWYLLPLISTPLSSYYNAATTTNNNSNLGQGTN